MKLVEFTYTKKDGSETKRSVVEVVQPTTFFEGIDVSELDQDQFAQFCHDYHLMKLSQHEETMQLLKQFDLRHNYRRFIPAQMKDVKQEYV